MQLGILAVAFNLLIASLQGDAPKTPQASTDGSVVVEQAWARVVPGVLGAGAVYFTIHNRSGEDDYLLAIESPVASRSTIHESKQQDGIATMEPVPGGIEMPPHAEIVMRPGGLHVMLTGVQGVKPGDVIPIRIVLREAGILDIAVPVVPLNVADPGIKHLGHRS